MMLISPDSAPGGQQLFIIHDLYEVNAVVLGCECHSNGGSDDVSSAGRYIVFK